jgi:Fe-S-cluster-containing dehydrogenase component
MERGTMQKCTLCVDRIYNETLDEADRQPACVMACPTRARHFGDLGDADSAVSKLVAEREGYALMPEFGYQPVNRYLPPRPRRDGCGTSPHPDPLPGGENNEDFDREKLPGVLRWLDRVLSR